jgi:hypothetical protein
MPIDAPVGPPKTSRATAKTTVKASNKTAERTEALNGIGSLTQAGLIASKQYADAQAIGMHWPKIADELASLANSEAVIARFIDPLIKAGPYTALAMAVLPLVAQISVNHKVIPAGTLGTMPGDVLGAQMELAVQKQQIEMRQAQQESQRQLDDLQRQMAEASDPADAA